MIKYIEEGFKEELEKKAVTFAPHGKVSEGYKEMDSAASIARQIDDMAKERVNIGQDDSYSKLKAIGIPSGLGALAGGVLGRVRGGRAGAILGSLAGGTVGAGAGKIGGSLYGAARRMNYKGAQDWLNKTPMEKIKHVKKQLRGMEQDELSSQVAAKVDARMARRENLNKTAGEVFDIESAVDSGYDIGDSPADMINSLDIEAKKRVDAGIDNDSGAIGSLGMIGGIAGATRGSMMGQSIPGMIAKGILGSIIGGTIGAASGGLVDAITSRLRLNNFQEARDWLNKPLSEKEKVVKEELEKVKEFYK